jgi:hypothetical protein
MKQKIKDSKNQKFNDSMIQKFNDSKNVAAVCRGDNYSPLSFANDGGYHRNDAKSFHGEKTQKKTDSRFFVTQ